MPEVSSSIQIALAVVLILYVIGLLALSIYANTRVNNEEDYLVAGRRLPLFLAWGTLMATWFGAASMVGACQAARDEGVLGTVLDPFACGVTLILAGLFFAKPLWEMKLLTMGDFYRQQYGTKAEILASVIQVFGYFAWIASQYTALAAIQHAYFGIPMYYGVMIAALVTMSYTMIGGMWSVTLTDTLQLVIALLGLVILSVAVFNHVGEGSTMAGIQTMFEKTPTERITLLPSGSAIVVLAWMGAWATGLFGNIPGQDLQQRVFAANGPGTARKACVLAGILYLAFGMLPVGLGLCSHLTHPAGEGVDEASILPQMAQAFLSPVMIVVFTVSVVSMIVSTATSAVLAPAAILGHNLLGRLRIFDGHHLFMERLSVMIVTAGGFFLASFDEEILGLLAVSLEIALVGLFVPLVMAMYGKPKGQLPAILAMSLGTGMWAIRFLFEEVYAPLPDDSELDYDVYLQTVLYAPEQVGPLLSRLAGIWGLIPANLLGFGMSFLGYFIGQLLTPKPMEKTAEELLEGDENSE